MAEWPLVIAVAAVVFSLGAVAGTVLQSFRGHPAAVDARVAAHAAVLVQCQTDLHALGLRFETLHRQCSEFLEGARNEFERAESKRARAAATESTSRRREEEAAEPQPAQMTRAEIKTRARLALAGQPGMGEG